MPAFSGDRTPQTLLARLRQRPDDQAAWTEFTHRYAPVILFWCRQKGLQAADAEDVTQVIFVKLCQRMRTFEYDPTGSFRGWLRGLTHHAYVDFIDGRRINPLAKAIPAAFEAEAAPEELAASLDAAAEEELQEKAMANVQRRVKPRTWEAFVLTALKAVPGTEAARALNLSIDAVYRAKFRVLTLLKEEVRRLGGPGGDEVS